MWDPTGSSTGSRPGVKSRDRFDDRADEEQQPLERDVLAERHEVHLPVDRADGSVRLHQKGGVVVGATAGFSPGPVTLTGST